MKIIIIGGGAAGFFAAIAAAENFKEAQITILERGKEVLQKVKISGGGRCNVTNGCFVNRELVRNYPRGEKELMSPFSRFSTGDTMDWFERRGVSLKIENDGRVFPTSNNSQTIIDCLYQSAIRAGVEILRGVRVDDIALIEKKFYLKTNEKDFYADKLMIATGSATPIWHLLKKLGHRVVEPVPSLFTFNIKDKRIENLAGISFSNAEIQVLGEKLKAKGALLITHWGLSGPAILRLSAWGARILQQKNYQFDIKINFTNGYNIEEVKDFLIDLKNELSKKNISATPQYGIASRYWQSLTEAADIPNNLRWADISKKQLQQLAEQLAQGIYKVQGKSTFKDEFVTAGGVALEEVNFKNFESKIIPNLYFAGEVLDIDAITGGFNFQAAWSGGWIVGNSIGL